MITIDDKKGIVTLSDESGDRQLPMDSPEAFKAVSDAWLRVGWDSKYVYSFTWMGRPIIQLPEDMIRLAEVIYTLKPDLIIETGIAHGGSLIYYASLFQAMGKGRVVGVDIEIRPHNRTAIESHELYDYITMIEGSSIAPETISQVKEQIRESDQTVLVILDSNHLKDHVSAELAAYSSFVTPNSYIIACDGIMGQIPGAPRTEDSWSWNNPTQAAAEFVEEQSQFILEEPKWAFNEGSVTERVTYWPGAFVKRIG